MNSTMTSSATFIFRVTHGVVESMFHRRKHFIQRHHFFMAAHFSTERRIQDIRMNPNGYGPEILPGGVVVKKVRNEERKILAERAFGNFWMMSDLKKTDNKPILSNEALIPEEKAQVFPSLGHWVTLENPPSQQEVPDFFLRNNRAEDSKAQCTLVAIAFKEFGAQMLGSWTEPFQEAFAGNSRVEVVYLNITEGWFLSKLKGYLTKSARSNTSEGKWATTLLHYAASANDPSISEFKDRLRMHNTLTGYVYLLDGLGRVRCAGSGPASPEEAELMIEFAKDLTPMLKDDAKLPKRNKNRRR